MHFVDLVNLNFFIHRMCDPTVIPEPLGEMQIYSFCRYVFLKSIPYIHLSSGPGRAILSNGKRGDRALSLLFSRALSTLLAVLQGVLFVVEAFALGAWVVLGLPESCFSGVRSV
jgi:hypothetical protein